MDDIKSGWDVAHLVMHSAFDELGLAATFCRVGPLDPQTIPPMDCFFLAGQIMQARAEARRHLVKAVALFQAGMESLINYWVSEHPEIPRSKKFVEKWKLAFTAKGQPAKFDGYATFYRDVRNAVIHPDSAQRIATIDQLRFIRVHEGMKHGWEAFGRLSAAMGDPHDKDSWRIMCEAHRVPLDCPDPLYPDLLVLRSQLLKRFDAYLKTLKP
jgi:hypothetical protein